MIKKEAWKVIFVLFLTLITAAALFYFSSGMKFKIGELVYKEQSGIGRIEGVSLPGNYLVKWQDESLTEESFLNLKKLSDIPEENVKNLLSQNDNSEFSFYSGDGKESILSTGSGNQEQTNETGEAAYILPGKSGKSSTQVKISENKDCQASYICGNWGECEVEYDFLSLISEGIAYGTRYRNCKDLNKCLSDVIDSEACSIKQEIKINRVLENGENVLEIYSTDGIFLGKISEKEVGDLRKLNINFNA